MQVPSGSYAGAIGVALFFAALLIVVVKLERDKNLRVWLPSYFKHKLLQKQRSTSPTPGCTHLVFCFVDHFEPLDSRRGLAESREIMRTWVELYPRLARRHSDSEGFVPKHTWFYPGEAYWAEFLDALGQLSREGYGEVELHLHHGYDDEQSLRQQLETCKRLSARHGHLIVNGAQPQVAFAFIHGNMALCNSREGAKFCGVNNELRVLQEAGCFADFSLPTYPCVSQTRKLNSIYYASSRLDRSKGHNDGVDVRAGGTPQGHLLLVQGPLALNWERRKGGLLPRVENSEICESNPGTPDRVRLWVDQKIHVQGREDWIFVKVSCHGAQRYQQEVLLGDAADCLYSELERRYRGRNGYRLHYVTAREMFNIIKAAEAGKEGNPHDYRDFVVPPYLARTGKCPRN